MTARGTVVLLVVLAGLAAYLWLADGHRPVEETAAPLLAAPAAVARVEFREAGREIVLVRDDAGWPAAASDLLATLARLRPLMVVDPDPARPADYGLGERAGRLRLVGGDGRLLLALEVGDRNPAWTGLYARLEGRREVVLLGGVLRWELAKLRRELPDTASLDKAKGNAGAMAVGAEGPRPQREVQ